MQAQLTSLNALIQAQATQIGALQTEDTTTDSEIGALQAKDVTFESHDANTDQAIAGLNAADVTHAGQIGVIDSTLTLHSQSLVPAGTIVLWSGQLSALPSGWLLCDGANGTPDLRDRFLVGAGLSYGVGATGGADLRSLSTANLPSHNHAAVTNDGWLFDRLLRYETRANDDCAGSWSSCPATDLHGTSSNSGPNVKVSMPIQSVGGGQAFDIRPRFVALALIIKQ